MMTEQRQKQYAELILEARNKKCFLAAQGMEYILTPDELEREQKSGKFDWDISWFQLMPQAELLAHYKRKVLKAQEEYNAVEKRAIAAFGE